MSEVTVTAAEVYEAADGFRFRTKGGNGQIIATGEAYQDKRDAFAAARASVPEGAPVTWSEG